MQGGLTYEYGKLGVLKAIEQISWLGTFLNLEKFQIGDVSFYGKFPYWETSLK
jgi:hypothetical protein